VKQNVQIATQRGRCVVFLLVLQEIVQKKEECREGNGGPKLAEQKTSTVLELF
jgi:hypothetical protein